MRHLFLEGEVELYTRAWNNLLNPGATEDTLANMLASSVALLRPVQPFDFRQAKEFLRQYPPRPPSLQEAVQKRRKPISFRFHGIEYDKGIDEKPIKHWKGCWLKFCYVLRDTLSNEGKDFEEVVWYRNPLSSPFDYKPRWVTYELIEGTIIVVHTGMDSKSIKREMIALARHFGFDPPTIKEVDQLQNIKLDPTRK